MIRLCEIRQNNSCKNTMDHSYLIIPWLCKGLRGKSLIRGPLDQDLWNLSLQLKRRQLFLCWIVTQPGLSRQHFCTPGEPSPANGDNNELRFGDDPRFSNMFQQFSICLGMLPHASSSGTQKLRICNPYTSRCFINLQCAGTCCN